MERDTKTKSTRPTKTERSINAYEKQKMIFVNNFYATFPRIRDLESSRGGYVVRARALNSS